MTPEGRYIVYPKGALDWSEIKATVELLEEEGKNPKIVKYKGLWNVEAGVKVSERNETDKLIVALAESNIDPKASDKIIERLERYENAQESEYYTVLETCKDDMEEEFEAAPKIQLEIEQFTDEQLRAIAENIGEALIEGYRVALRKAVEEELNAR
jgi:hypothetical protein